MFDAIATVLSWFYDLWPSYGVAIVLLTLTVMVILTPLTLKGTRSMMVMQSLQPEMKKIQQRYKDDRQKMNEELLNFYRENKINPLGGCLPLLVQLPVFIVLYRVLHQLTRKGEDGTFNPSYLDHESALYQALDKSKEMVSWGIDLSKSATSVLADKGFGSAWPYLLLIIGVTVTSYVQQRQISGRNPNAMNPQQAMLMKIFPAFFAFISLSLPGGLVLYFFISNLYRVGQQALISHTIYKPAQAAGIISTTATDAEAEEADAAPAPKGFLERMLGDAAPRLGDRKGNGTPAKTTKPTSAPAKNGNRSGPGSNSRTTPSGKKPQSSGARRKKRKR